MTYQELADLLRYPDDPTGQESYVQTFEFNPACTLEIGWHLFGENYERGEFLVRMREQLRRYGIAESTELPDHLALLLPLIARMDPDEAAGLAGEFILPALAKIRSGLQNSPYESVIAGIAEDSKPTFRMRLAVRFNCRSFRRSHVTKTFYLDEFLFAILPYMVLITFLPVTIQRYRARGFTYSSLSSQFLENQQHFWSMVPFHYGILAVTAGHIMAVFMPRQILSWNSQPLRLYLLEITGLICAALALVGLCAAVIRRFTSSKVRQVTTKRDWILLALLMVQIASGIGVAIFHPWGSSWFAAAVTPYLRSLAKLNPDLAAVSAMPLLVKVHIVNAYLVIGYFPFTRLVHVLVVPNPYLWRKPQVVRWHGRHV